MPFRRRISDSELRERLEKHGYNVPPILCNNDVYPCVTETIRANITKKLSQLDTASKAKSVASRSFGAGLDYSSSEDDDTPTPTMRSTRAKRQASPKNTGYSLDTELVSFLILCLPAVFFLIVSLQYLSLAPVGSVNTKGDGLCSSCVSASQISELVQPRLSVSSQNNSQKVSSLTSFLDLILSKESTVLYIKTASYHDQEGYLDSKFSKTPVKPIRK